MLITNSTLITFGEKNQVTHDGAILITGEHIADLGLTTELMAKYPDEEILDAQGKLVMALQGEVFDVAVDIRKGSPTYGQWVGATLSDENFHMLYIPPGFAHGFCVLSAKADFVYLITAEYDVLRDEAEAYAKRLKDAGNHVSCVRYHGLMHAFVSLDGVIDKADQALTEIAQKLREMIQK